MVSDSPTSEERAEMVQQLDHHKDVEAHSAPQRTIMEEAIHGAPMPTDIAENLHDIAEECIEAEKELSLIHI